MTLPILRHHDSPQIWMPREAYAKEVKYLTFKEVGGGPERCNRLHGSVIALKFYFKAHPLFQSMRQQMINHLKARLRGIPVNTGEVREKVELRLQNRASLFEVSPIDIKRE